jgi:predicted GIY-YIG superfamily endonuclease
MTCTVKGFADYVTYVLLLEEGRYYIGLTRSLKKRLDQHCNGQGAKWTKLYAPVSLVELLSGDRENEITNEYIFRHGADVVRGGDFCCVKNMTPKQWKRKLKRMQKRNSSNPTPAELLKLFSNP